METLFFFKNPTNTVDITAHVHRVEWASVHVLDQGCHEYLTFKMCMEMLRIFFLVTVYVHPLKLNANSAFVGKPS